MVINGDFSIKHCYQKWLLFIVLVIARCEYNGRLIILTIDLGLKGIQYIIRKIMEEKIVEKFLRGYLTILCATIPKSYFYNN